MSPLMTKGARSFMPDIAVMMRSCCFNQPDCQYGLADLIVSFLSDPRTSGYHSPHFPAVHPGGFDGTLTTWATSLAAIRAASQRSTSRSTYTALGPASVAVRRRS